MTPLVAVDMAELWRMSLNQDRGFGASALESGKPGFQSGLLPPLGVTLGKSFALQICFLIWEVDFSNATDLAEWLGDCQ